MVNFTIVPGTGNSGPTHWQTLWEARLPEVVRIAPTSWDDPDDVDWQAALDVAADQHKSNESILIAHSLGCLAAARWSTLNPSRHRGLFLVAPPDEDGLAAHNVKGFRVKPTKLPVPTIVVMSSDDPVCSPRNSRQLAKRWGATVTDAGPVGHINAASELGDWAFGWAVLSDFSRGLLHR